MPRKSLGIMTESMFYTILAFQTGPCCGTEIAEYIEKLTKGRIQLGPGTLYTILSKFVEVGYVREIAVEGRKRTYELTMDGLEAYRNEIMRLQQCLEDAQSAGKNALQKGDVPDAGKDRNMAVAAVPAL